MARRITEEVLTNGEVRYWVQTDTVMGIPTKLWRNEIIHLQRDGIEVPVEAAFNTLEEARSYLGLDKEVVSSKVIIEVK